MKKVTIKEPEDLPADPPPTATQKRIWEKEVDEFTKRREVLNRNLEIFYSLLWDQCEPTIIDIVNTLLSTASSLLTVIAWVSSKQSERSHITTKVKSTRHCRFTR